MTFSGTDGIITDAAIIICDRVTRFNETTLTQDFYTNSWYVGTGTPTGSQVDLWSVITHELGHVLGLGHSAELPLNYEDIANIPAIYQEATMFFGTALGTTHERTINEDDINGVRAIYGAHREVPGCVTEALCVRGYPCPDRDCDSLTTEQEALVMSDPDNPDTDGDDLGDGEEVNTYGTNPVSNDTDRDGLPDYDEIFYYPCDENAADSDGDGLSDGQEVRNGLHCDDSSDAMADYDGDGLSNAYEVASGMLLNNADSDGDNIEDGVEIANVLDPMDPSDAAADADNDGLTNLFEFALGASMRNPDSDGDGLRDGAEYHTYHTSPTNRDTDGDGLVDGQEVVLGLDPTRPGHPIVPIISSFLMDDDDDYDGIDEPPDNCLALANPDQVDTDQDNFGDACDLDDDNDGVLDTADLFPLNASESADHDGDGMGDNQDTDDDSDGWPDNQDCAPLDSRYQVTIRTANNSRLCVRDDEDDDNDGICDRPMISSVCQNGRRGRGDNCPLRANASQTDYDCDGRGTACEFWEVRLPWCH